MDARHAHKVFLGTEVGDIHAGLYDNYPKYRGFSSGTLSQEIFDATFVLALKQALEGEKPLRTFLFVPTTMMNDVQPYLQRGAQALFSRWKGKGNKEVRVAVVQKLAEGFKHILLGSHSFEGEPTRWVALGFQRTDKDIPEWMGSALLDVPPETDLQRLLRDDPLTSV